MDSALTVSLKRREHNDGYWAVLELTEWRGDRTHITRVPLTLSQVMRLTRDIQAIPLTDQERRAVWAQLEADHES